MQALLFCHYADESAVLTTILQQAGFSVRSIRNLDQAISQWPEQPSELIMLVLTLGTNRRPLSKLHFCGHKLFQAFSQLLKKSLKKPISIGLNQVQTW